MQCFTYVWCFNNLILSFQKSFKGIGETQRNFKGSRIKLSYITMLLLMYDFCFHFPKSFFKKGIVSSTVLAEIGVFHHLWTDKDLYMSTIFFLKGGSERKSFKKFGENQKFQEKINFFLTGCQNYRDNKISLLFISFQMRWLWKRKFIVKKPASQAKKCWWRHRAIFQKKL